MGLLEPIRLEWSNRHTVKTSERVKALRTALDLTQEQVAARSQGQVNQGTLAKIEGGKNNLTGAKAREGLAHAFDLGLDDFADYLAGSLDIRGILARQRTAAVPVAPRELRVEREDHRVPDDGETPEEAALLRVMDPAQFTMRDLDAARAATRAPSRKRIPDADLDAVALDALRAARALRLAGEPTDPLSVMRYALEGRHARTAEVVASIARDEEAESAERLRALGHEPGQGRAELEARANAQRDKRARRAG